MRGTSHDCTGHHQSTNTSLPPRARERRNGVRFGRFCCCCRGAGGSGWPCARVVCLPVSCTVWGQRARCVGAIGRGRPIIAATLLQKTRPMATLQVLGHNNPNMTCKITSTLN
uniref:Uncharacterized protein n=1 Tax=Oryza glumipatula TaxID=40148 RepID=A0A0D9Z4I3_9ORYZ